TTPFSCCRPPRLAPGTPSPINVPGLIKQSMMRAGPADMQPTPGMTAPAMPPPSLSVRYQRNLLACWILQAVADQQEEWPLQPGQRMALPTGSVFGAQAKGWVD